MKKVIFIFITILIKNVGLTLRVVYKFRKILIDIFMGENECTTC